MTEIPSEVMELGTTTKSDEIYYPELVPSTNATHEKLT